MKKYINPALFMMLAMHNTISFVNATQSTSQPGPSWRSIAFFSAGFGCFMGALFTHRYYQKKIDSKINSQDTAIKGLETHIQQLEQQLTTQDTAIKELETRIQALRILTNNLAATKANQLQSNNKIIQRLDKLDTWQQCLQQLFFQPQKRGYPTMTPEARGMYA